jgi:hypothetical protein
MAAGESAEETAASAGESAEEMRGFVEWRLGFVEGEGPTGIGGGLLLANTA